MGQGDNKCAACGQFSGRGHKCPTPTFTSPNEAPNILVSTGGEPIHVDDRVARAQAMIDRSKQQSADPAIPAEYADREWANSVYWPNVKPEEREAFAFAMDSTVLNFYAPAMNETGDGDLDYADIDAAGHAARVLRNAPSFTTADMDSALLDRLDEGPIGEYSYLAEDGGEAPSRQLLAEWRAQGCPGQREDMIEVSVCTDCTDKIVDSAGGRLSGSSLPGVAGDEATLEYVDMSEQHYGKHSCDGCGSREEGARYDVAFLAS